MGEIMDWKEVSGLFPEADGLAYQKLVESIPDGSLMVEVGCLHGKSLASVAHIIKRKNIRVWAVDIWDSGGDTANPELRPFFKEMLKRFCQTMRDFDLHPFIVCGTSFDVIPWLNEKPQLVFLDNDHSYNHVKREIAVWWPKVSVDGILAGHDYICPTYTDHVIKAVEEAFSGQAKVESWVWNVKK
jgi:cephalosporin hydroxylase